MAMAPDTHRFHIFSPEYETAGGEEKAVKSYRYRY